jgi:hypothetical protein
MRSSSIVISSSVNVDSTAQQTTLMAALATALATNSALAGFTIETSSLTAVTSDQTVYSSDSASEVQKYKNIAIIVGVVIPFGLSNYLNNFSYPLHRFLHAIQERNSLR